MTESISSEDARGHAEPERTSALPRLAVLGPLVVETAAGTVSPRAARQRRLFTILAVAAGRDRSVTVEEMAEALYGADASPRTRHSLATELWRARRVLGAESILTDPDGYRLDLSRCEIDSVIFEVELAEGRALLHAREYAAAEARLAGALALWRGDPLAEWRDHPLGEAAVTRLAELRAGGTVDHAEALVGTGRHQEAVQLLDVVTAEEPTREHAWALLVEACLETGQLRHARAAFDTARRTLAEYGVDVGAELSVAAERLAAASAAGTELVPAVQAAAPVLVGRDGELARVVDSATQALREADPAIVVVSGEAGIGKSALVEHAANQLRAASGGQLAVGRIRCDARLDLPYAALLPLLAQLVQRSDLVPPDVANLLDGGTDAPAGQPMPLDSARKLLTDAIATLVEAAARGTPQVLIVEDAHWATAAALDVVLNLHARHADVPLCMLLTVREPSAPHPDIAPLLAEIRRRARQHVLLRGLNESAAAQLLGSDPDADRVRHAHRLSGGNPLYLTQLARLSTLDQGTAARNATLAASIQDHLSCLPPETRAVLQLAAVAGTQFDVRILTAAAARAQPPISLDAVADAVDAAAAAGLLRLAASGGQQASFVHALVRDQLYADLPPHARRVAHALVGQASERVPTGGELTVDLIAHHYSAAWPECSTASVVDRLHAAGNQAAAQLGFTKAREYLARALDLTAMDPSFADLSVVAALLEASAQVALALAGEQLAADAGRVPDPTPAEVPRAAFTALGKLAVREALVEVRLRAALGAVSTYTMQRMADAPLDELDTALTDVLDAGTGADVRTEIADSVAALCRHRSERGHQLLERAVAADPAGSGQLLRAVWECQDVPGKLATAHRLTADTDAAGAWLRLWVSEVAAGQRALDDPPPVLDRLPAADDLARWELTVWRIATAIATGRFDRAHRLIAAARRTLSHSGPAATTASRLATLTAQELRLYTLRSADPPSTEQIAVPKQTWSQSHLIMVSWRGYAAAAAGSADAARAACDMLVEELRDDRVPAGELLPVTSALAVTAVEVGHRAGTQAARAALAEHGGEHATNYFTVYWGAVDHYRGQLAAASGDLDEAIERFESAVVQHRHAGARPYEARSLNGLAAARWHRGRGRDRPDATTSRRAAVALSTGLAMSSIDSTAWPPPSALR